ncbi:MAG: porin family protein [Flavobacterium sp.]
MKKIILILCFIGLIANAQTKSFGMKAGMNLASLRLSINDLSDSSDSRFGANFGFFAEFPVSKKITIQPEILYTMTGGSVTDEGQRGSFGLNYIAFPIMVKYYTTPKFSMEFGPQFAFLAESTFNLGNITVNANELFNNFDLGFGIGVNYEASNKVFLNFRYTLGLFNIASAEYQRAVIEEVNASSFTMKNNVIQFGIGYRF